MIKISNFLRKRQTSSVSISKILRFKNGKFSGYCFYMNPTIKWNFQIYHSVPLIVNKSSTMEIMLMLKKSTTTMFSEPNIASSVKTFLYEMQIWSS